MRYPIARHRINLILVLVLVPVLAGCGKSSSGQVSVGILSAGTSGNTVAVNISVIAEEQNSGYTQAGTAQDNHLGMAFALENDPQDEIQVVIRNLAQDAKNPVAAFIGGTSNKATMQIAGLVNFFNVPMIVPTADGNTLLPANNLWAFRISAPSSAYANYLFTDVINEINLESMGSAANFMAGLNLAILYEQNTFGESAAVAAAESAMTQGISIVDYQNFPADNPSTEQLAALVDSVKQEQPSLVYLIASNPATADALVQALQIGYASGVTAPIIMGQAGGFTSGAFLKSAGSSGIYILRQRWDRESCPAEITTFYQAQSYGAAYLLNYAVGLTQESLAGAPDLLSRTSSTDELVKFRETLRDKLKGIILDVPCLGNVAFDTTGQNKLLEFEILTINNGNAATVTPADFLQVLNEKVFRVSAPSQ